MAAADDGDGEGIKVVEDGEQDEDEIDDVTAGRASLVMIAADELEVSELLCTDGADESPRGSHSSWKRWLKTEGSLVGAEELLMPSGSLATVRFRASASSERRTLSLVII